MPTENHDRLDIPTWPLENEQVHAALVQAYETGDWGRYSGAMTARLCESLSQTFAGQDVTLASSGTIAVELALRGLGVKPEDEVILAGYDFPGNFRAIEAIGARPVLIDLMPNRWAMDVSLLDQAVSDKTAVVICSHLHGDIGPIQDLVAWNSERNIRILEDTCQAPGACLDKQNLGTFGDAAVLSFGGSKLLTAGRGGAVLSSDQQVHQRIKVFGERGNLAFPMSELQAAVICPQLSKLDEQNKQRQESAERLIARLSQLPWTPVQVTANRHAFYKLAWMLDPRVNRTALLEKCEELGVPLFDGFRGFTQRSERRCGKPVMLTESEKAANCTVLLHHPVLLACEDTLNQLAALIESAFDFCEG